MSSRRKRLRIILLALVAVTTFTLSAACGLIAIASISAVSRNIVNDQSSSYVRRGASSWRHWASEGGEMDPEVAPSTRKNTSNTGRIIQAITSVGILAIGLLAAIVIFLVTLLKKSRDGTKLVLNIEYKEVDAVGKMRPGRFPRQLSESLDDARLFIRLFDASFPDLLKFDPPVPIHTGRPFHMTVTCGEVIVFDSETEGSLFKHLPPERQGIVIDKVTRFLQEANLM